MDAGKGKEEAEGAEARGRNDKRDGAEAGTGEMGIGGMRGSWGGGWTRETGRKRRRGKNKETGKVSRGL